MEQSRKIMNKTILAIIISSALVLCSTDMAYATNHNTSMFSDAQRYSDANSYKNANYSFSIQPPINWVVLGKLPSSVANNAVVIFSNNDKSQLATFGIYHRHITPNVIEALDSHTDNDILATISQEMTSGNDNESQTVMYNGIVDRYSDGVLVTASSATKYVSDNTTSLSETRYYFLNNGNQYNLVLTSNYTTIDKNSQLFEDSANTFFVTNSSPVPEFPVALAVLVIGMFSIIFVFRAKGLARINNQI